MNRGERPSVADLPALREPDGEAVPGTRPEVRVLLRGKVPRDVPDLPEARRDVVRPADADVDVRRVRRAPGAGWDRSGEVLT